MKGQFKAADRYKAKHVIILGEDELSRGAVLVKEMSTGEQNEIPIQELVVKLKEKLVEGNIK
jgi:histidyl-tRNA synthetase